MIQNGFVFLQLALDIREDLPDHLSGVPALLMCGQDLARDMAGQRGAIELMRALFLKDDMARGRVAGEARQLSLETIEQLLEQASDVRARPDVLQLNDAFHAVRNPSYAVFLHETTVAARPLQR